MDKRDIELELSLELTGIVLKIYQEPSACYFLYFIDFLDSQAKTYKILVPKSHKKYVSSINKNITHNIKILGLKIEDITRWKLEQMT